ncbi:MAG: aminomethyl-transferring glycine dehydrogenase subunit GcvPB [Bacillota bacterium]|jgi:glycine dehydrogenase subunit 2
MSLINKEVALLFEKSVAGRIAYSLPDCDVPFDGVGAYLPQQYLRSEDATLPQLSELDVVRHYTQLSQKNHGVDGGFYPLGSCTMKYNPKINEDMAALVGFTDIHPYQDEETVQGNLDLMYQLQAMLAKITGMDNVTLMPAAGAHGEMTGLMMIKAYHESRGEIQRTKIIVPDSAHGTNPASAVIADCSIIQVKTNADGGVDLDDLQSVIHEETGKIAALMLTNPNTLGLFDENILQIAELIHKAGGLLYYDGANANAIMGISRPGDMGFDVVHLNLHKTFSTPHGGGGPGAGPVAVKEFLAPFLPVPVIIKKDDAYHLQYDCPHSIGRIKAFYGNFLVLVKAFCYILSLGSQGLKESAEGAVLNANYLMHMLKEDYDLPFEKPCMHEFILSAKRQKDNNGVSALDIAKRLLDFGYHPPTIYFPLIVGEALMIEPTESESKAVLDEFIQAMKTIAVEAAEKPDLVKSAPHHTPVKRLDEVNAARNPVLIWQPQRIDNDQ